MTGALMELDRACYLALQWQHCRPLASTGSLHAKHTSETPLSVNVQPSPLHTLSLSLSCTHTHTHTHTHRDPPSALFATPAACSPLYLCSSTSPPRTPIPRPPLSPL